MDNQRREELRRLLDQETSAPETREWREEELEYVGELDGRCLTGMAAMASASLVREKIRARFAPREIMEIETAHDHCRLRLRDGSLYLARLDRDGGLLLDELDGVC